MNINDDKDLRPNPKTHPINTNTRARQLSPFTDQLADFCEPPFSGRNLLTDHKKISEFLYSIGLCTIEASLVEFVGSPTARIYCQLKESLNMLKTCFWGVLQLNL